MTGCRECSGECEKYRAKLITKYSGRTAGRYKHGQKRCKNCDLFMYWDKHRCPCCNTLLSIVPVTGRKNI